MHAQCGARHRLWKRSRHRILTAAPQQPQRHGQQAARQLETHTPGPLDDDEILEGRTRAETRAVQQQNTDGLIATLRPIEGDQVVHALMAGQVEKLKGSRRAR